MKIWHENRGYQVVRNMCAGVLLCAPLYAWAQAKLPENLKWETNETDPVWSSPEAKKGGVFHYQIGEFPLTLRTVGPDANGAFANYLIYGGSLPLVDRHPNTGKTIPMLADKWAYGADNKTMYFHINNAARWSDGKPITADDFLYTEKFSRSKEILDPYANDYWTSEIAKVVKFDDKTIALEAPRPKTDLDYYLGSVSPVPRHFYGEPNKDFVRNFNWKIAPVSGPYIVDKVEKGKLITQARVKNWWGENLRYFKHRFNVDTVEYRVYRDEDMAFEQFKKGALDAFWVTRPVWWHDKAKGQGFDQGYIEKLWFYNELPEGPSGMWLNLDHDLFKDKNARYAFAHAMNFDLVIQKLLYNDYERKDKFFEGYGPYSDVAVKAREFNIAKVKEYLEKSGWHRGADGIFERAGKRFSVKLTIAQSAQIVKRMEVLKEEARKAGVELLINAMDGADSFKAVREKKFEVYYGQMSTSVIPAPVEYFHSKFAHKPQTNNFSNVDDPEMDKQLDRFQNSFDSKEREDAVRKILVREHDLGTFVPAFRVSYTREAYWRWWRMPTPPGTKLSDSIFTNPVHYLTGGTFWYDEKLNGETKEAVKTGKTFPPVVKIDKTYKAK